MSLNFTTEWKKYRRRNGEETKAKLRRDYAIEECVIDYDGETFTADGFYFPSEDTHPLDLVEEISDSGSIGAIVVNQYRQDREADRQQKRALGLTVLRIAAVLLVLALFVAFLASSSPVAMGFKETWSYIGEAFCLCSHQDLPHPGYPYNRTAMLEDTGRNVGILSALFLGFSAAWSVIFLFLKDGVRG